MNNCGERLASVFAMCALGLALAGPAAAGPAAAARLATQGQQQPDVPSLESDDIKPVPVPSTETAKAGDAVAETRAAAKGYTRVVTKSGYSFERPDSWKPITDIAPKGAPSFFTLDAMFQDAKTGAVATAASVDRTKLKSPMDISDKSSVDSLLTPMLNGGDAKAAIKVRSRESGEIPDKDIKWVRVQADGTAKTQSGGTVPTTFWVEMLETPNLLALVAVGYPSTQQTAATAAERAVHSLQPVATPVKAAAAPKTKKPSSGSAGGMETPKP